MASLQPASISDCQRCQLAQTRKNIVWERGWLTAKIMIIGEGPGKDEDRLGRPFVGRAGKLLDDALSDAGLDFSHTYITNMVKCRPPENRNPSQKEMDACFEFLCQQYALVQPSLLVTLGKVASEYLLQRPVKITKENGKLDFLDGGLAVMTIYHPAYVLRNQKPEIREGFFQAIQDARNIAYGLPNAANDSLHKTGVG